MIERIVIIDNVDPQTFYGGQQCKYKPYTQSFPEVADGGARQCHQGYRRRERDCGIREKIHAIEAHASRYNRLDEEAIIDIVRGDPPKEVNAEGVIIYGQNGKPIAPRNANQTRMVRSFAQNDLTFALLGPAGTGKTYIAIALAVHALKNKLCRKIILSRPAVEAGEKLGFLPGDMKDKIDLYLQPLYDALRI